MIDYQPLYTALENSDAKDWLQTLAPDIERAFNSPRHGELDKWLAMLDNLPNLSASSIDLVSKVRIGDSGDSDENSRELLEQGWRLLVPKFNGQACSGHWLW